MLLNKAYEFRVENELNFSFDTDNFISYDVKFKPSDYIFEGRTDIYIPTFELSISVAINETGKNPPLDPRVSFTIASIFYEFYNENKGQVVIFICDSSDRKQVVRRRKFNQWADTFKGNDFFKFDVEIIDTAGIVYYNSIILRANNPYRLQILNSFLELANEQTK